MGDPLSITSSVIAIITAGLGATRYLYNFYSTYANREANLKKTNENLKELLDLLEALNDTVQRPKASKREDKLLSLITSSIRGCTGHIESLNKEAIKFHKELTDASSSASRSKSKIQSIVKFAHGITYPFAQGTLETLNNNIQGSVKQLILAHQILVDEDINEVQGLLDQVQVGRVKSEIRVWLKAPDATVDFNEACSKKISSTGMWFVANETFSSWLTKPNSFLWVKGFSGCGKTVLCSTAIQHTLRQSGPKIGVAFFFFSFRDEKKQDASSMLRALLLQLSNQLNSYTLVEKLYERFCDAVPPNGVLTDCLRGLIRAFDSVYILLDALDESPQKTNRDSVLKVLTDLHEWSEKGLHMFVTSRDEPIIREEIELLADQTVTMDNKSTNQDIASFVSRKLHRKRLEKWKRYHDRIRSVLTDQSKGNFRWVDCQLQEIERSVRSQEALDRLLESLPPSLEETYKRLLAKIEPSNKSYAQRMLTFLCYAKRPLTVEELISAMAVDLVPLPTFNDKRRLEDEVSIQELCPGLVEVDKNSTVHIAHFSVQQYLESDLILKDDDVKSFAIISDLSHTQIASTCLVFLEDPSLEENRTMDYARYYWSQHVIEGRKTDELRAQIWQLFQKEIVPRYYLSFGHSLVLWSPLYLAKYYKSTLCCASSLGFTPLVAQLLDETNVDDILDAVQQRDQDGIYSLAVRIASASGHLEVVQLLLDRNPATTGIVALELSLYEASLYCQEGIIRFFLERKIAIGASWALAAACRKGHTKIVQLFLTRVPNINVQFSLLEALRNGYPDIAQLLLKKQININIGDELNRTALYFAVESNFEDVVESILAKGANVNAQDDSGDTALMIALRWGHSEVSQLLIAKVADVNIRNQYGDLALHVAAKVNHTETISLLLDRTTYINQQNDDGQTALYVACRSGHEGIVQLFLARNADINVRTKTGKNALHAASEGLHTNIIQLLLDKSPEINAQDLYGSTALHLVLEAANLLDPINDIDYEVVQKNQERAFQLLLERNASITLQDSRGYTALWYALAFGQSRIVNLLPDEIVDTDAQCNKGERALYVASKYGHEEVVQLLLDKNADVNAETSEEDTALFAASRNGHEKVVHLLLNSNADIRKQDKHKNTALIKPSEIGYYDTVLLLLDRGIDINAQGYKGLTALHHASSNGHDKIVQLLLDRGADANVQALRDGKSITALDIARYEGYEKIVHMLISKTTTT